MFKCTKFNGIEDYFKPLGERAEKGVFFYRLMDYNAAVRDFLGRYLDEVKKRGVFIMGKLQNPDERQLSFFEEIMGLGYKLDRRFLDLSLSKWLPRLDGSQRESIARSMYGALEDMGKSGKNENMQRNAYIKFMCWLYYKFERILNQLGKDSLPKILFEGNVGTYELMMLSILAAAGCDILLLLYDGDGQYLKTDPGSRASFPVALSSPERFPQGFSIAELEKARLEEAAAPKPAVPQPEGITSTNTWITGDALSDSLKEYPARGDNPSFYYNLFVRMRGAEDKSTYVNELLKWKLKLDSAKRKVIITEKQIPMPDASEVAQVPRKNYKNQQQLIADLTNGIAFPKSRELEKLARKAFFELMQEYKEMPLQRLSNRAVCIRCWINRFIPKLFSSWQVKSLPVFVYYGVCGNENEAAWMKFLARLPVDVLEICPDLSMESKLSDKFLFEKKYEFSLPLGGFPQKVENVQFGTMAYNAERDLDTIMYQDTGVYRNRQFKKAITVRLQITYEEISILWGQEAKYRPNFEVLDDRVMLPVIFSKISGVPGGNREQYWNSIRRLVEGDAVVITKLPHIKGTDFNPMKQHAPGFLRDGKLQTQKIKSHPAYPYAFIREDMQDYIFDKLQQLMDSRVISGTFANGTEYTIVSTALNLEKRVLRLIQKFDFTKDIPKLIIISAGEELCTIEDSIFTAFLSMLGFDIAIFSPTGYQNVERYFTRPLFVEHQAGDYIYDLTVPEFGASQKNTFKESFANKIFRRVR